MTMQRLIEQWNAIITGVLARVDAILAEASAGSQAVIPHLGSDLVPLVQPWQAVEHQMHGHKEEIADAWNLISDELSEIDGLPEGVVFQEGHKRDWATTEIEIRSTRAYRLAVAAAADVMRQHAIQADARSCSCTHCGATLDRAQLSGMALNVECGYCRAVNTIEPGQALRAFAATGALALAEREALPLWEEMTRALTQINHYRDRKDVPFALLEQYESAARGYWTTRHTVEGDLVPEQRPYAAQRIESNMKGVHKTLRQHWQWRQQRGA
jgi:hypothetical protein